MTRHGSLNSSTTHPALGTPATQTKPRCCARCRRGTPATGLGECGYLGKCACHRSVDEQMTAGMLGIIETEYRLEDELYRNHPEARSND